jgi:hypothetical protein
LQTFKILIVFEGRMKRPISIILYWIVSLTLVAFVFAGLREVYLGAIWKSLIAGLSLAIVFWGHKSLFSPALEGNKEATRGSENQGNPSIKPLNSPRQINERSEGPISSGVAKITSPTEVTPPSTPTSSQRSMEMTKEIPLDVNAKNDPTPATSNATESVEGWSEEFKILNEYDSVVKECHAELEDIAPQLAEQFREEIISDRKKAVVIRDRLKAEHEKIRDRLKAEHEKQINPYTSEALNVALAEARLLGLEAEEEFTRVVEVMGEDFEVEDVLLRLKAKYGDLVPPEDIDGKMEYWGIVKSGDRFILGEFQYAVMRDAIAFGQKKLDAFFERANTNHYEHILTSCGYKFERINKKEVHVSLENQTKTTLMVDELPRFVKGKFSPYEIRKHENYLVWESDA